MVCPFSCVRVIESPLESLFNIRNLSIRIMVLPLALPSSTVLGILLWLSRTFVSSLLCVVVGFAAIKALDFITVDIKEFRVIRGKPEATALFVGGFIVFIGLVIHGSALNPFFFGQSILIGSFFNLARMLVVILSLATCAFFGWLFYVIFGKIAPFKVDLDDINQSPTAVGAFLFCYEVFLGLVVHAALTIPL